MDKDYRITIEPITEEAKCKMAGPRIYEGDDLFCLSVHLDSCGAEDDSSFNMAVDGSLLGNRRLIATALANWLLDADYYFRQAIIRAMLERREGFVQPEFAARENMSAVSFDVKHQLADIECIARTLGLMEEHP